MRLPNVTSSSRAHLDFAAAVTSTAEIWQDAEIITPAQSTAIAEVLAMLGAASGALDTAVTTSEATTATTRHAWSRLRVRDVVLNRRVSAVNDGVLNGPAQRSRVHTVYKDVLLGGTGGDVTGANAREKPALAGRVYEALVAAPDFPAKAALVADLGEAVQKSTAAETSLKLALEAEQKAFDAEMAARRALRIALEQVHGKLKTAFPGQRDFVESFFPKKEKQAAKGEVAKPKQG